MVCDVRVGIFSFDAATVAIKGARPYQEDNLICSFPLGQDCGFAVLSDGMGGHNSGDVASALVVAEMVSQLKGRPDLLQGDGIDIPATLNAAAEAANQRVAAHTETNQETYGMGATLLSVVIRDGALFWVSVGDSPLLLMRDDVLQQLNKDHSMTPQIDMMVKVGALTAEMGRNHPDRSTLTSAISGDPIQKIDCPAHPFPVYPGDVLVVASDGLQFLTNAEIAKVLRDTHDQPSAVVAEALRNSLVLNDHPDQDNAAFVVIKVSNENTDLDSEPKEQRRPKLRKIPAPKPRSPSPELIAAKSRMVKLITTRDEDTVAASAKEPATEADTTEDKHQAHRGKKYRED